MDWSSNKTMDASPHITVEIGQSLIDQLFNEKLIHLLADAIENKPIPIQPIKITEGTEIVGMRVKKLRLVEFRSEKPTYNDYHDSDEGYRSPSSPLGGMFNVRNKFKSVLTNGIRRSRPSSGQNLDGYSSDMSNGGDFTPASPSSFTPYSDSSNSGMRYGPADSVLKKFQVSIREKSIGVRVVGMNIIYQADYVSSLFGKGSITLKSVNAEAEFNFVTARDEVTGRPILMLEGTPWISFGKLSIKFDNSRMRSALNSIAALAKTLSRVIASYATRKISQTIPQLSNSLTSLAEMYFLDSNNAMLLQLGFKMPDTPLMAIQNLHYTVKNYRLLASANVKYLRQSPHLQ